MTLNDPVYVEAAQALARRIVREGGDDASRSTVLRLPPVPDPAAERREAHGWSISIERPRADLAPTRRRRWTWPTDPLGPLPAGMDPVDLAAWTVVGNVLLNLDETFAKR